jgi:hypothetical protein
MKVFVPQWVTIGAPGFEGGVLRSGDDRDDRLATVADAIHRQDELFLGLHADEAEDRVHVVGDVRVGERPDEARDTLGVAQVDTPDPGVVDRASHDLEVEHPREGVVGRVLRPPGDVADAIAPRDRVADDVQGRAHRGCPPLLATASAALSIASTIGS